MLQGGRGCRYLRYNVSMKGLKSVIAICCHSWRIPKFYESILWVQFAVLTIRKVAGDFVFVLSGSQYYEAVFASLGVFLSFYVIAAVIGCVYHGWWVCYVHMVVLELRAHCLVHTLSCVIICVCLGQWGYFFVYAIATMFTVCVSVLMCTAFVWLLFICSVSYYSGLFQRNRKTKKVTSGFSFSIFFELQLLLTDQGSWCYCLSKYV